VASDRALQVEHVLVDFDESAEDAAFRAEARAWLDANAGGGRNLSPFARPGAYDDADWLASAKRWQAVLAEHRWAGVAWPEEYGGRGGTAAQAGIFNEEAGRAGVSTGVFAVGIAMAGPTIIAHGSEEQKRRYLPPMLRGDEVWCQLFSEPGAGSDLAGLSTRAGRDGDEWVVTGQKVWTSGAHHSDFGILLARTDPDVPKHRGITYFLLDMHTPGIEIRPLRQMTGASHFNEVFLTDVRVPHDAVLGGDGGVGGGWAAAMTTLANERGFMGSGQTGLTFDDLVRLARSSGVAADTIVRQGLAASYTRGQIARYLGMRVRTATSHGRPPGPEALVRKLFAAWHTKRNAELALAIQGAGGMLVERDAPCGGTWQLQFLNAPSLRIAGGSDEVQRNVMGERVLGLPAEPRVDKDVPFRSLAG
jgi:alkylation response protein AidB-like acyl-CoA dehydrogenase